MGHASTESKSKNLKELINASGKEMYTNMVNEWQLSKRLGKRFSGDLDLLQLENWKRSTFPKELAERYKNFEKAWKPGNESAFNEVFITKEELHRLMEWKLERGKFRAFLMKLIDSNDEVKVKQATSEGFKALIEYCQSSKSFDCPRYTTAVKQAITSFCLLKGVGPATASLILSSCSFLIDDGEQMNNFIVPPFFGDEAFEFVIASDITKPRKDIKYTLAEYMDLYLPPMISVCFCISLNNGDFLQELLWASGSYYGTPQWESSGHKEEPNLSIEGPLKLVKYLKDNFYQISLESDLDFGTQKAKIIKPKPSKVTKPTSTQRKITKKTF